MAYRRKPQQHQETFDDELFFDELLSSSNSSSSSTLNTTSLAAKAMKASSSAATRRDSSLSSAYGPRPIPPPSAVTAATSSTGHQHITKDYNKSSYSSTEYTSINSLNESNSNSKQGGFWGSLARKAKAFLDDDYESPPPQQCQSPQRPTATPQKYHNNYQYKPPKESSRKTEGPTLQKGLDVIASSFNYIGNAMEEGLTRVENRTAGIIQETRKHMKKKPSGSLEKNQATKQPQMKTQTQPQMQTDQDIQLKASRDVAMAMAAKAKVLLRELKTVKADLAFAKERCAQLEEENKVLRENLERGERPEDDDLIRLQLETLLAEKARLAHENSVYARENRFLREVVEYHQLTMQDVVYLDEGTEEVTEVYPIKVVSDPQSPSLLSVPKSSPFHPEVSSDLNLRVAQSDSPGFLTSVKLADVPKMPAS